MSTEKWKNIDRSAKRLLGGTDAPKFLFYLFCLHLLFIVFQLHSFPGISVLGTIRVPGVITFLISILSLPFLFKIKKYFLIKVFLVILIVEAIRGVLGYTVFPTFVVNDKWQFEIWQLLLVYLLSLIVPIVSIFSSAKGIRVIIYIFVFMGALLGLWSITHAGFGPGGYLHDENDHCLLLVSLLPFPFFLITVTKNFPLRLICLGSSVLLLFGIIITRSRGGYLGFFAVLIMFFIMSRRKGLWIGTALVIGLLSLPFIPQDFWGEVNSIKVESQQGSGTIQERLDTWGIVTRMWLDPKNTLFGVGLENSRFNLGDYEDAAAGTYVKSLRGRSTHSFYFQVLGDMGLYGVIVFAYLIMQSLLILRRIYKDSVSLEERLESLIYSSIKNKKKSEINLALSDKSFNLLRLIHKEIVFLRNLSPVVFSSWFGLLVSALGISVAYYPPFWLFCALSLSIYIYYEKIKELVRRVEEVLNIQ